MLGCMATMNEDEQKLASEGRCIMQVWSGVQQCPRGRQHAGHLGWTGYCGKKATKGHYCKGCAADMRSGNV